MNIQGWFPLGLTGVTSLLSKGTLSLFQCQSLKASILWCSAFFMVQLTYLYITTGKIIAFTRWTFAGSHREELRPWQRSWGRRLGIRKGGIKPQESPWKFSSTYPQNQSLPTLLLCALTYTSDFTGGCPGRDKSVLVHNRERHEMF